MPLRVYNTLSRQKEDFQTVEPGQVKMYLCGPTVYKPAHIGHMVGPVIFDTVKRYLTYCGYKVTWVVNITDVDDKLINRANEKKMTVEALAKEMTQDYFDNLKTMAVDGIDHFPYATQHIQEMQDIINAMPQATALDIMQDSRQFSAFIESAYPGALPAKYQDSAFDVTVTNNTIIVGTLKAIWQAPPTDTASV